VEDQEQTVRVAPRVTHRREIGDYCRLLHETATWTGLKKIRFQQL